MTGAARLGLGVLLAVAALALAACSPGAGSGSASDQRPGGTTSAPATPATPTTPTPTVSRPPRPEGWTSAQHGRLAFALPPGFTQRPDGAGMPGAAAQWTKADDPRLKIPPAVAVFVETENVGPLPVRTELVTRARTAELGAEPTGPARDVRVPGSLGAQAVEWKWDYDFVRGQPPVPSRQVEILVQTQGPEQYGLLIGGPVEFLTDDVLQAFEASIAVVAEGSAA